MSNSDEIEFDPKTPAVDGTTPTPAIDATVASSEAQAVTEIAAAIASGQLDAAAAQQLLIDRVLAGQFPDVADLEPLRARLAELLADDPTLARLLTQ